MSDVRIKVEVDSKEAQSALKSLQREIAEITRPVRESGSDLSRLSTEVGQVSDRSRQTSASMDVLERRMNTVRRETLDYRTQLGLLNRELAENRQALLKADDAARETIETRNRQIRAEQGLIRVRQQSSALTLSKLQQERRELGGVSGAYRQAAGGTKFFTRAAGELAGTLGAIGITEVLYRVADFGRASVRASIQIDSATRALGVLTGSASEAEQVMRELQDLADAPGLTFRQASAGVVALRAIGTEADTTTRILRELANAAAFSGGEGEFERGLLGFRQIIQRGRVSQEELNQLVENIGLASRVLKEEFGTVLAEDIQAELDRTGQSVHDFVERVLTGFERLERFPLDAPSVKLKNLSNSFFEFQAAVGDLFLPIVAKGAEGLTAFFDTFTKFISITDEAREAAESFSAVIAQSDDALSRDDAIQNRIKALEYLIRVQNDAIDNAGFFSHRPTLEGRRDASEAELGQLRRVAAGDPEEIARLREQLAGLNAELREINEQQSRINSSGGLARLWDRSSLHNLEQADIAINKQIDDVAALLIAAEESADGIVAAEREKAKASEAATAAVEASIAASLKSADAAKQLLKELRLYRETIIETRDEQASLNDFWRRAAEGVDTYKNSLETVIPSVNDLSIDISALTQAIDANLSVMDAHIGDVDELIAILPKLSDGLTSVAADQAIASAEAKLLNQNVSAAVASMRSYLESMDQMPVAFQSVAERSAQLRERTARVYSQVRDSEVRNRQGATDASKGVLDVFDAIGPKAEGTGRAVSGLADIFDTTEKRAHLLNGAFNAVADVIVGTTDDIGAFGEALLNVNPMAFSNPVTGILEGLRFGANLITNIINENREREVQRRQQRREQEARGLERSSIYDRGSAELGEFRRSLGNVNLQALGIQEEVDAYLEQVRTAIIAGANIDWDEVSEVVTGIISKPVSAARTAIDRSVADIEFLIRQERSEGEINTSIQTAIATITSNISVLMDAGEDISGAVESLNNLRLLDTRVSRGSRYRSLTQSVTPSDENLAEYNANAAAHGGLAHDASQEEIDAFIEANAPEVASVGEITGSESIAKKLTEQLDINVTTTSRIAESSVDAITAAMENNNVTAAEIVALWNEAKPKIEAEWQALYDKIQQDPNLSDAQRAEQFAALGNQQDFVSNAKASTVDPALERIRSAAESLETTRTTRLLNEAVTAFSEAVGVANLTVEEVLSEWAKVKPKVEGLWQELYDDIANDPNLSDAQRIEDFSALGTQQDFATNYKADLVDPVIAAIKADNIADGLAHAKFEVDTGLDAFRAAAKIGTVTVEEIQTLWDTHVVPNLRDYYDAIIAQANSIDDVDDRKLYLAGFGIDINAINFDDFDTWFTTNFLNPSIDAQKANDIADGLAIAESNYRAGVAAFNAAARIPGVTLQKLQELWDTHVVPNLASYVQSVKDHANTIEDPDKRTLYLKGFGVSDISGLNEVNVGEFFYNTIFKPVEDGIRADDIGDNLILAKGSLDRGVTAFNAAAKVGEVTNAAIQTAWDTHVSPHLSSFFQALRESANLIKDPEKRLAFKRQHGLVNLLDGDLTEQQFIDTYTKEKLDPIFESNSVKDIGNTVADAQWDIDRGIEAFQTAIDVPGITSAAIQTAWNTHVEPHLMALYTALLAQAGTIGDRGARTAFIRRHGISSYEAFSRRMTEDYERPVIEMAVNAADEIETRFTEAGLNTEIEALSAALNLPNQTKEGLRRIWDTRIVPMLKSKYEQLKADALAEHGNLSLFESEFGNLDEFLAGEDDTIFRPFLDALSQRASGRGNQSVKKAKLGLDQSGDEGVWNTNFKLLREAVDAFYKAEKKRIEDSGLTGQALTDALAANQLAWDSHLANIDAMENPFFKERIDKEKRVQDEIQDIRDKQTENEADRLAKIADANRDHQETLTEIEKDGMRDREDLNKSFQEKVEDIKRASNEKMWALEREFREGDIRESEFRTGMDQLWSERTSALMDVGRDHNRALSRQTVEQSRAVEDAETARIKSIEGINLQAEATATALSMKLAEANAALGLTELPETISGLSENVVKESANIDKQVALTEKQTETAATESATSAKMVEVVNDQAEMTVKQMSAAEKLMAASEALNFDKLSEIFLQHQRGYEQTTNRLIQALSGHSNSLLNFSTDLGFLQRLADRNPGGAPLPQQQPLALPPSPTGSSSETQRPIVLQANIHTHTKIGESEVVEITNQQVVLDEEHRTFNPNR